MYPQERSWLLIPHFTQILLCPALAHQECVSLSEEHSLFTHICLQQWTSQVWRRVQKVGASFQSVCWVTGRIRAGGRRWNGGNLTSTSRQHSASFQPHVPQCGLSTGMSLHEGRKPQKLPKLRQNSEVQILLFESRQHQYILKASRVILLHWQD